MMMSCGSATMNTVSVLPRNMPGIFETCFESRSCLCHDLLPRADHQPHADEVISLGLVEVLSSRRAASCVPEG